MTTTTTRYYAALERDLRTVANVYVSHQQPRGADGIPDHLRDVAGRLGARFVALDVAAADVPHLVGSEVSVDEDGVARVAERDRDWCDGSGPGAPCGAEHHDHSEADALDHACTSCGTYTPGAETHVGGLCQSCAGHGSALVEHCDDCDAELSA